MGSMSELDDASLREDFMLLSKEFENLQQLHKSYVKIQKQISELQSNCAKEISHQRYRLSNISSYLKECDNNNSEVAKESEWTAIDLKLKIKQRQSELSEISKTLPQKSDLYLQTILGSANLSILSQADRFKYKDEYEKFKLSVHFLAVIISVVNIYLDWQPASMLFKFLMFWYYCILTLRESILKLNGSKIRGWWKVHHFFYIAVSGLLILWPEDNRVYLKHFRSQLLAFCFYTYCVQFLQFRYQRGCLYRLRSLGKGHNMDLTIEGFQEFMWRGLGFLLPFHIVLYLFELNNATALWSLWMEHPDATWHMPALGSLFFLIFMGNIVELVKGIPRKYRERMNLTGKFAVAFDRMKKASSSASLVAAGHFRKFSSSASLSKFASDLYLGSRSNSVENGLNLKNDESSSDENDNIVFSIDSTMVEKHKKTWTATRYPLQRFANLSHRRV